MDQAVPDGAPSTMSDDWVDGGEAGPVGTDYVYQPPPPLPNTQFYAYCGTCGDPSVSSYGWRGELRISFQQAEFDAQEHNSGHYGHEAIVCRE